MARLALSSQTGKRYIRKGTLHLGEVRGGERPTAWALALGSVGFRQCPEAELSLRDTATEGQVHSKLESSIPGTQVGRVAIVGQAVRSLKSARLHQRTTLSPRSAIAPLPSFRSLLRMWG